MSDFKVTCFGSRGGVFETFCIALMARYGLELVLIEDGSRIPGSFWGEPEAGLIGNRIHARRDTPVHSLLHEASHYICMDPDRRQSLHTDAGGTFAEEDAVCYLQILLADHIHGYGNVAILQDMDSWGYMFRLGSSRRWFLEDADDARQWLQDHGIIDHQQQITWRFNKAPTTFKP